MKNILFNEYNAEKAVSMYFADYEAIILPEKGGNLISFKDLRRNYSFLRSPLPKDMDHFRSNPVVYGIPVLFPPNRYEGGTFTWNGYTYHLPINEISTGNHLHGFFYNKPWRVIESNIEEHEVYTILEQQIDEQSDIFTYFPHCFNFRIRYSLGEDGVRQEVTITNTGNTNMPCMLGFHTVIQVPFSLTSLEDDYTFTLTIGKRLDLSEGTWLPTGTSQILSHNEERIKIEGISPFFEPVNNHYTAEPINDKNCMVLKDDREKVQLIYEVGMKYSHWMLWNDDAKSGFFCPEPQTNRVNAPNLPQPAEETGLITLKPGEKWYEVSRLYVEDMA